MTSHSTEPLWAGAWLVATYKGFSEFNLYEPAFHQYETTILAARAAQFLSAISQLGRVKASELEIRQKLSRLKPSETLPLLRKLAELGLLEIEWRTPEESEVQYVAVTNTSRRWVFESTGKLFYALNPSEQEQASLLALDLTASTPLPVTVLHNEITKRAGFSRSSVSAAVDHLTDCGLLNQTQETEQGNQVISNPYAFRSMGEGAYKILSKLSEISPEKALELLELIKNNPGVPLPADTDQNVLEVLISTGLIDHSGIRVRSAAKIREFPTIPHLWGVFETDKNKTEFDQDLVDDAKLFLNSVRYGQFYSPSGRGRINDPIVLVDKLISRGEVGPATAIGSDYPLPLSRGIVSIVESRIRPGRFHMQLRKKDVAQSVLEILEQGTILDSHAQVDEGLWGTSGQYQAPETVRVARKLPSKLQKVTDELAFELRSHRMKR